MENAEIMKKRAANQLFSFYLKIRGPKTFSQETGITSSNTSLFKDEVRRVFQGFCKEVGTEDSGNGQNRPRQVIQNHPTFRELKGKLFASHKQRHQLLNYDIPWYREEFYKVKGQNEGVILFLIKRIRRALHTA